MSIKLELSQKEVKVLQFYLDQALIDVNPQDFTLLQKGWPQSELEVKIQSKPLSQSKKK